MYAWELRAKFGTGLSVCVPNIKLGLTGLPICSTLKENRDKGLSRLSAISYGVSDPPHRATPTLQRVRSIQGGSRLDGRHLQVRAS